MASKTTQVRYSIANAVQHDQPRAAKANPAPNDAILRIDGIVSKDGTPQKTPHFIVHTRQMPEFVRTVKSNGSTLTFTLTEKREGRKASAPTPAADLEKLYARFRPEKSE